MQRHRALPLLPRRSELWVAEAPVSVVRRVLVRDVAAVEELVGARDADARGYDVSQRDASGDSALILAVHGALTERRGAASGHRSRVTLLAAILGAHSASTKASLPAALSTPGSQGMLPLHLAAAAHDEELMRSLIRAGACMHSWVHAFVHSA